MGFKETVYELSDLKSKTRKASKLDEIQSSFLINCLEKFMQIRKDDSTRCGSENSFAIKDIYEEIFKRLINPIFIVILSLLSSLIILKSKINYLQNYFKFLLFFLGFVIIIFSELSYKFISLSVKIEMFFLFLPILFILFFYFYILVKSNFKLRNL